QIEAVVGEGQQLLVGHKARRGERGGEGGRKIGRDHQFAAAPPQVADHGAVVAPEIKGAGERPVDLHETLGHAVGDLADEEGMVIEARGGALAIAAHGAAVEDPVITGVAGARADAASIVLSVVLRHTWPYGIYRRTGEGPRRDVPGASLASG